MATNTSDELVNLMQGVQGDPSDPNVQRAKLNLLFSRWGRPQVQPSSAPDEIDANTPGAGSDGGNAGYRNAKPAPGASEMSAGSPDTAEPKPASQPVALERAGHVPQSQHDDQLKSLAKNLVASGAPVPGSTADLESRVGLPVGMPQSEPEKGSTEDLENRAAESTPGLFLTAARASEQKPRGGVLGVLGAVGKQVLGRLGNAGYAISGGDPREMRLKEQGEQFEEEMQRMKSDPDYLRRAAEAQAEPKMVTSPDEHGGYSYEMVDPFSGRGTATGVAAPSPEKTPAQLLAEFQQTHPQSLIKGTPDNAAYEELAESLRAFPSQQATIRANAEMFVGRMGVQRASIMANAIIRSMQGRNISTGMQSQADAVKAEIDAATKGWADYFTAHPYLQAMGYGPDADSQARFMGDRMAQLADIADQANELTQKIPGAAKVVPSIIHNAANAANRGKVATQSHIADYARQKGISVQQAEQEFKKSGYTVIPAPMTR